jgi:TonB family protein
MLRRYPAFGVFIICLVIGFGPIRAAEPPRPAEEKLVADGAALLRVWLPPVYPAAALKARQSGMVNVRLIIDETGHVTAARALEDSDAPFIDAALAAVNSWQFAPAIDGGKPTACCLETLVTFSPAIGQQKKSANNIPPDDQRFTFAPRVAPQATVSPPGNYPDVLVERKFAGVVRFACVITTDGAVIQPRIIAASHVDFVLPALESLNKWEFTPGMQGDLVLQAPIDGRISFDSLVGRVEDVLTANGFTAPDGTPPAVTPEPLVIVDPVLPVDALLKGEGGSAVVDFTVTESGAVRDLRVREATHPDFGEAVLAALEMSLFARPVEDNRVVSVAMTKRAEFRAVPTQTTGDADWLTRLVTALRAGEISGAKGLDQKLTPIYQVRPEYPRALKENGGPAGQVEVEFIIDRDGRVRLPRVVSSSHPEFGWAAATAVSQWVFNPPRRSGAPADIKVKIPINFAALAN